MRAKTQVGSDENKSDDAEPGTEQPRQERAVPEQPQRPEPKPEVQQTPGTPPADPAVEEVSRVSRLPCVHVIEAIFTELASIDTSAVMPAAASVKEKVQAGSLVPAWESPVILVAPEAGRHESAESRPGLAIAAFALESLVFYQQEWGSRRTDEERKPDFAAKR